jgi:hypothetical protein
VGAQQVPRFIPENVHVVGDVSGMTLFAEAGIKRPPGARSDVPGESPPFRRALG